MRSLASGIYLLIVGMTLFLVYMIGLTFSISEPSLLILIILGSVLYVSCHHFVHGLRIFINDTRREKHND